MSVPRTGAGTNWRALHLALTRLAEQDPLIGLRHDEVRREILRLSPSRARSRR
ncbi:hypothetical protein AB0I77_08265 [Streptomyces sp. NPDC050619]|uniref:hypothetical protein n=1 Tax=Streptomyces sp. NPDC050619 TaxID=3157214 RepID=UPI00342D3966